MGCARAPIRSPQQAMRPSQTAIEYSDDMGFGGLSAALKTDIDFLKNKKDLKPFRFGPREIAASEYLKALETLQSALSKDASGSEFSKLLRSGFEPYEVYGLDHWGEIFMTSYYEPVIDGSRKKTAKFTQALYAPPKDLVEIQLAEFKTQTSIEGPRVLRGRLLPAGDALAKVIPYPAREDINRGALKGAALPLFYVDPVDGFNLEVQGSGVVRLTDGKEVHLGYAAQNGHPYVSIGKFLFDVIPREKMNLNSLETYLRSVSPEQSRQLMEKNPSYVFFKPINGSGLTYLGTEVVAGRTIATDATYFPKGALAYLEYDKPEFNNLMEVEPHGWHRSTRFVLDQDVGGAIRGPHRVDLFWGRGQEGKQVAAIMKNKGRLVYLVPTAEFLKSLEASEITGQGK